MKVLFEYIPIVTVSNICQISRNEMQRACNTVLGTIFFLNNRSVYYFSYGIHSNQ